MKNHMKKSTAVGAALLVSAIGVASAAPAMAADGPQAKAGIQQDANKEYHHTMVHLVDSAGVALPGGEAWALAADGTWIDLSTTTRLAPGTYQFTMDYKGTRSTQEVLVNDGKNTQHVYFQTAKATVNLIDSKGQPLTEGDAWVQAPGGTWTQIGATGSSVSVELLPGATYNFTMDYRGARSIQSMAARRNRHRGDLRDGQHHGEPHEAKRDTPRRWGRVGRGTRQHLDRDWPSGQRFH